MHIRNVSDLGAYDALPVRHRQKAWHELMSSHDRKRMQELRAFLRFIEVSGLAVDRATAVCPDPPSPDICCGLGSSRYLFELGEVTDEGLAQRYSESLRTGQILGGWFSQAEPLTSILTSKAECFACFSGDRSFQADAPEPAGVANGPDLGPKV
jgi:hypothetical protein